MIRTHGSRRLSLALVTATLISTLLLSGAASASGPKTADAIVDAMIEAHGGMKTWAMAPTVHWQDSFLPAGAPAPMVGQFTVEQGPRRAYGEYPGTEMRFSWDGEKAWSENWSLPFPPRFLALLNYHFLNLPWLAKDPGVHLGKPGTARLWDDPTQYLTIKITYAAGVGDTPDDYYVLYIHPQTHQLKACQYIVTYQGILPEGVEAGPVHLLVFDEFTKVSGLLVPSHYTIYNEDHTEYATCNIGDWSFTNAFDEGRMAMSAEAILDSSQP